jgi:hypothetical protein
MLPRLTAEQSLLERERIAMGTGAINEPEKVLRAWTQQASGGTRPQRAAKATPDVLAAMGIGVVAANG